MSVLLTGGTGFVGGEVLLRLLSDSTRSVICLVRADSAAHAAERGQSVLKTYFGARAKRYAGRVEWLAADMEREGLGLSPAAFAWSSDLMTAMRAESTRLIWPAPTPTVSPSFT